MPETWAKGRLGEGSLAASAESGCCLPGDAPLSPQTRSLVPLIRGPLSSQLLPGGNLLPLSPS